MPNLKTNIDSTNVQLLDCLAQKIEGGAAGEHWSNLLAELRVRQSECQVGAMDTTARNRERGREEAELMRFARDVRRTYVYLDKGTVPNWAQSGNKKHAEFLPPFFEQVALLDDDFIQFFESNLDWKVAEMQERFRQWQECEEISINPFARQQQALALRKFLIGALRLFGMSDAEVRQMIG